MEDLINFDIIEGHKENIQSLPGGRSAKALASTFAPPSLLSPAPTLSNTRTLNDAIRQEYELELIAISDSDDPLDIYDRYVKWTLNAYPSAQATPESQLRPLLERATKAFQSTSHYKNDPRYLKLWLTYIRFFSDAPRETFAYLARHSIGESLALFYEEFAAWLEGAGRWTQAEEVYKLGIEREARPTERLLRKFGEFQHRFEQRPHNGDEPSSPALPTIRPALVAKMDPFAVSTPRPADPQAQRQPSGIGGASTSRGARQKLAIFSDADAPPSTAKTPVGETSKGWENIGSLEERKKENIIEVRPWAGETLKAGKKVGGPPKMMIFKDEQSLSQAPDSTNFQFPSCANLQEVVNPKTGKVERVFVNLEAVYPNPNDSSEEMSFEELRATCRGWMEKDWAAEKKQRLVNESQAQPQDTTWEDPEADDVVDVAIAEQLQQDLVINDNQEVRSEAAVIKQGRSGRPKKMKIREVRGETQTIKTNLASPTGPKLRRKNSAEPTMTLHTRAATDDILDIFNQPLRNLGPIGAQAESGSESDSDDDDYTSAGESTGTGRISATSEFGEDVTDFNHVGEAEETDIKSVSPWSDYTSNKLVPKLDVTGLEYQDRRADQADGNWVVLDDGATTEAAEEGHEELVAPISPISGQNRNRTKFIPLPPEDYEPPMRPYRDPSQASQNRVPFMTPIIEKTESSIGASTDRGGKDYFNSKTPSRRHGNGILITPELDDELLSSPFQEIVNEAAVERRNINSPNLVGLEKAKTPSAPKHIEATDKGSKGPIIKDAQCNPVDDTIRNTVLENLPRPLSSYQGFHDHRPQHCNKAPEVRKYVKALSKVSKNASDKTTTNISLPPTLRFPGPNSNLYTMKRELGKGAFAPVYLAEHGTLAEDEKNDEARTSRPAYLQQRPPLSAIKCEDPPTPWEFYIMATAHRRLGVSRAADSILKAYEMHLFADEGYLIEEYRDQGTLLDLVNTAKADTTGGSGVLDEAVVMFFTVELLRTVEALHSKGLLHGDLKADNCLVRLLPTSDVEHWDPSYRRDGTGGWAAKGLSLIDFGRGIDMKAFGKDVQFVADWKTSKADCAEMREMRPWTYQVDYWGLAGVVHSLLFGKYIEDVVEKNSGSSNNSNGISDGGTVGVGGLKRYRVREGFKRYWQTELWQGLFDVLLNPARFVEGEVGGRMPVARTLRACREGMEEWLEGNAERKGLKGSLRRLEEKMKERR